MSVAKKQSTKKWYIHTIISIAIMVFFRFIPAPEPMTQLGITVVGIFSWEQFMAGARQI